LFANQFEKITHGIRVTYECLQYFLEVLGEFVSNVAHPSVIYHPAVRFIVAARALSLRCYPLLVDTSMHFCRDMIFLCEAREFFKVCGMR